jgi:hypothetical protein
MANAQAYERQIGGNWEETDIDRHIETAGKAGVLPHTRYGTELVECIVTTSGRPPRHDDSPSKEPDCFFHDKRIGQSDS